MNRKDYKPRIIDKTIIQYLKSFGAVCVEGPKWCGKTWTSSYHSSSEFSVGDPSGISKTEYWRKCPLIWS